MTTGSTDQVFSVNLLTLLPSILKDYKVLGHGGGKGRGSRRRSWVIPGPQEKASDWVRYLTEKGEIPG